MFRAAFEKLASGDKLAHIMSLLTPGRTEPPVSMYPLDKDGSRTESIAFDVVPGAMYWPYIYGDAPPFGRYGFAIDAAAVPDELAPYAVVRRGRVQVRSRFRIPIECHDPKGLIFKLQVLDALNRHRNELFREVACEVTACAVFKEYVAPRQWSGWIISPEKITIASW
jgi:hypothetical protein